MERRPAGFTLLEVLISIAIFAITISIVYGLYTSIISVVQNVEERTGLNDRVQVTFTRLNLDLSGLYRGEQGYLHGLDSAANPFEEDPFLEFVSSAHLFFDPDADPVPLSVIRYYLAPDEQGETYSLLRSDTPLRLGEAEEDIQEARKFKVCEGLMEVVVTYMNREGSDLSEWDTREGSEEEQKEDSRFPAWVSIELVFPPGDDAEYTGAVYSTAVLLRPALMEFPEGIGG